MLPLLIAVPLLPLFGADEAEQRRKVARLKAANPAYYAYLRQETRAFLALPPTRRQQLVQLDQDLHGYTSSEQKHLVEVMNRYTEWLYQLPEAERRQVLETKDRAQRLRLIRQLRERQWLRSQPRAVQERVERLEKLRQPPAVVAARTVGQGAAPRAGGPLGALASVLAPIDPAADYIARLKAEEKKRQEKWQVAGRHWEDLLAQKPMPNLPIHFGRDVDRYVNDYLRHLVSKEEWERLKAAEGHWPQYPYLLVELADRHPLALPGTHGMDRIDKLPLDVKEGLAKPFIKGKDVFKKKNPKQFDTILANTKIKPWENHWPQFGTAVAEYARDRNLTLPTELWPARLRDLSPQMREFVTEKLAYPHVTREEMAELKAAEGHWPKYPNKIQELADRYHLHVPWLTLPPPLKGQDWNDYRPRKQAHLDGFPEVPLSTLRDFALLELTKQERDALALADDPASWQKLTKAYFQAKPGELKRLRQADQHHKHPAPSMHRPPHLGPPPRQ
jgi:hypothetical protein